MAETTPNPSNSKESNGEFDSSSDLSEKSDDKNNSAQTPLHRAVLTQDVALVIKLLKEKAHPNAQDDELDTPLQLAVKNNLLITRLLLNAGAKPNIGNLRRETPLHAAAINPDPIFFAYLIEAKAHIYLRNAEDFKTMKEACNRYTKVAKLDIARTRKKFMQSFVKTFMGNPPLAKHKTFKYDPLPLTASKSGERFPAPAGLELPPPAASYRYLAAALKITHSEPAVTATSSSTASTSSTSMYSSSSPVIFSDPPLLELLQTNGRGTKRRLEKSKSTGEVEGTEKQERNKTLCLGFKSALSSE